MQLPISIPVITYNHEDTINQALNGILMQEINFDYEIIIGEDCSTDSTREKIAPFIEKYPDKIRLITSNTNVGAIQNAKRTLANCSGKYLALCEGDDFWVDKLKLQKQIDFLEANPDYGMVHTDVNHYIEEKQVLIQDFNKKNKIDFPSGDILDEYLKGNLFIKTASVVVRRDLFLQASDYDLFTSKKWPLQDLPTWLGLATLTKIKYLPETCATYRLSRESASRNINPLIMYRFHTSVYNIRLHYWKTYSNDKNLGKHIQKQFLKMRIVTIIKLPKLLLKNVLIKMLK